MSLSKSNINILSSYVKNWQNRPFWSDILLSNFIGKLNKINQSYVDNYMVDLFKSLFEEEE